MNLLKKFAAASACCLTLVAGQLMAEDTKAVAMESGEAKACCAGKAACESGGCPIDAAMANLPKMTFLVGDKETCCSESAASLAKAKEQPIQFKVGEETFESKTEAMTTLISKTESMVNEFTTPHTCSVSGKTTIAGTSCDCPMKAKDMASKVESATKLVSMSYKVGDETCNCPNAAKAMAKKAGAETTFVVDGEETQCEMTARLNLARAKYKAAVTATLASAPAPPASTGEVSSSPSIDS